MHGLTKRFAPIFCLAMLQGCGGGGGAKPPAQPPTSNEPQSLKLTTTNYQTALQVSIGTTMTAFNFVKLGGDLADLMLELPVPSNVLLLPCPDGGTTLMTIGDRNSDGFFNAGDYVNQAYDDCESMGSTIDGIIRVDLERVTPAADGREIEVLVTVVNLTLDAPGDTTPTIAINLAGLVHYTQTTTSQRYQLAGAQFSSTQIGNSTGLSVLSIDFLQDHAAGTYRLLFGGQLDSAAFEAPFDFITAAPFDGTIGAHPTTARLSLLGGGNSSARLSEEGTAANNPETVLIAVDANGDGNADLAVPELAWSELVPRQLFDEFRNPEVVVTP